MGHRLGLVLATVGALVVIGACTQPRTDETAEPGVVEPRETALTPTPATPAPPRATPTPAETDPTVLTTRGERAAGTVADPEGNPPPTRQPAADLRAVEVVGDDEVLLVRFLLDGPIPDEAESLLWSFEIHVEEELAYTVTVQQLGSARAAAVFDWQEVEQAPLDDALAVSVDTIEIAVPWSLLPRAHDGYAWAARTQLDQAWEDRIPPTGTVEARR